MSLKDMKNKIQNTLSQVESVPQLKDELYTIKEISQMLKTSKQHVGQLLKTYEIETINISAHKNGKKPTYRIKKSEVYKLRKALNL